MKVVIRSSSLLFSFLGILLNIPLAKVRRKMMKGVPETQAVSEPPADQPIPPGIDQSKPEVR